MANGLSPYQRLYPAEEVLVLDGGIDKKFEKALIPENESPDCLNVEAINASVTTRQGSIQLNTAAAGAAAFDGLYSRRDNQNNETMCAFIGGSFYTLNVTTFITVPSAQSVFTAGSRVGCELAENYLFIGNGGVGPYKWDGSLFTVHGVYAPAQTATVNSSSTGSLTTGASYQYVYTNVNTHLVESNVSPAITFTVTSTGGPLAASIGSIASGATASMGVNARYLYRTKANTTTPYFRVTKINDVATTSFVDTLSDSALGSNAPTDNGTPPLYNAIAYHANILFTNDVNNGNYVWYSVVGQPYTFSSNNFFKVGDNTSDLVKGFASYNNYIVVFCELSTWINYMPNPSDATTWRQIRTNSPYGSKSPYCMLHCNVRGQDILLHPAVLNKTFVGFGALSGDALDPTSTLQPIATAGSDLQSQVLEPDMFNISSNSLNQISGIVYKNRAFISVPKAATPGGAQSTNNTIYVWDFSLSNLNRQGQQVATWWPWTGTGLSISQFCIYGGKLYGASSTTNGFVYQLGDTAIYNDAGTAINSYIWTKELPGNPEDTQLTKDFRYANILYDNAGNYNMGIIYKTDSDLGTGTTQQINLNSGGTNWGAGAGGMIWGTSKWGGGVSQTDGRIYLGSTRGKRLSLQFNNQNTINQRFKVHRLQFLYNIRGYR